MPKRITLLMSATAFAILATSASFAPPAQAGDELYCQGSYGSGARCLGDRHSLRKNIVATYSGSPLVAAAAKDVNHKPYGNWVYGYGGVCHSYSGDNLLYPWLWNASSSSLSMYGHMYYGSELAC